LPAPKGPTKPITAPGSTTRAIAWPSRAVSFSVASSIEIPVLVVVTFIIQAAKRRISRDELDKQDT
jgi:hypothetical protein